jgi:dipeptidyl aminopeptidase/acylaminoacyl peptidase
VADPYDLWHYNTDGSGTPTNLTQLAATGIHSSAPDISPDGSKVIFSRWSGVTGETWNLYLMNLDGTGVMQVTDTPSFSEYEAVWAPDGQRVAFRGQHIAGFENTEPALPEGEANNANIYVVDAEPGGGGEEVILAIFPAAEIAWDTQPGVVYQVQCSTDLENWEDWGDPITGDGGPVSVFVSTRADPDKSFRVVTVSGG